MKNKLSFIAVTIVLLFLTLSVFAQENSSAIDNLLTGARERQKIAKDTYDAAVKANKSQTEMDTLEKAWDRAKNDVKDLEKIKAELASSRTATPKQPDTIQLPATRDTDDTIVKSAGDTTEAASNTIEDEDCEKREGMFSQRICELAINAKGNGNQISLSDMEYQMALVVYGQAVTKGGANASEAVRKFILDAEAKRTDKQVGSDSNSKGTTSIVVKGGVPDFFNFAAENGAATRTISGTTATFRFNPIGILQTLPNYNPANFLEGYQDDFKKQPNRDFGKNTGASQFYKSRATNYLRKLSVGLSFDASRNQEIPTLTGDDRQLSAFSLRYEFVNDRNPRNPKWKQKWTDFFNAENARLIKDSETQARAIFVSGDEINFKNNDLKVWFADLNTALGKLPANASIDTIETAIRGQIALLPVDKISTDKPLINSLNAISTTFIAYFEKRKKLLDEIAKAPVITLEYTNTREPVLPDTHNFNFIFAKGFSITEGKDAPVMDFTFNASLTFLNKKPATMDVKRIRDFSFAGQLDVPLFSGMDKTAEDTLYGTTFSLAGKYQRLTGDITALDGTILPNTKGDIWVGQAKLVIPFNFLFLKGKGIAFPISATFANRTELVRESRMRGNFGFTFDLDKLILNNLLGSSK